jgi:hypothetical protein
MRVPARNIPRHSTFTKFSPHDRPVLNAAEWGRDDDDDCAQYFVSIGVLIISGKEVTCSLRRSCRLQNEISLNCAAMSQSSRLSLAAKRKSEIDSEPASRAGPIRKKC